MNSIFMQVLVLLSINHHHQARSLRTADAFPVVASDDRKCVCGSQAIKPAVSLRRKGTSYSVSLDRGGIFMTGLTIMGLLFQKSYQNGEHIFEILGLRKVLHLLI